MPLITLALEEDQHRHLLDEYNRMTIAWLRDRPDAPPPFEQWLVRRFDAWANSEAPDARARGNDELREELQQLDVIEKFVTVLQKHGFALAQVDRRERDDAVADLARALAPVLGLTASRIRRLEELLAYYARSAREVADAGHVQMTNRMYGALHEAVRALGERSERTLDRLGRDRAFGRFEGGLAILILLQAITRQAGREKAEAFRRRLQERG